jgi:hypothetical protein
LHALVVLAGCSTSPDAPLSLATLSVNPQVHSVRAQAGYVSYTGASYHRWTLTFATIEGCTGDAIATVELITLASTTDVPIGTVTLRPDQNAPGPLPSAYLDYQAAPLVTGTVTIDTAREGFITGSLASQVTLGGVATDVNGTFSSPTCP